MTPETTIAIATFAYSNRNYGQILQAYALQKYLENCGYRVYIIDYTPNSLEYFLTSNKIRQKLIYILKNIPPFKFYFKLKKGKRISYDRQNNDRNFENFKRKYLHYSKYKYEQIKELRSNKPKADYYITGSDQVWSRYTPNPYPYLLQFIDTPNKLAYAASFGRPQLEDFEISVFKKELNKYKKIGVREESGVEICKNMNITNCQFTPDPTILLQSAEWKELMSPHHIFKTQKKKIFIYSCYLHRDELIEKFINLEEFEIVIEDVLNDDKDIAMLSIEEWIKAINEADYVITNSFHATMFCLYMNTPFITYQYQGSGSKMNVRLTSILNQTNLMNHFVPLNTDLNAIFNILKDHIDWKSVNVKLDEIRKIGYDFLNDGLERNVSSN